jgi:hypothetical protein
MTTQEYLGQLAEETVALQAAIAAQPDTTDPVTGKEHSSYRLVGGLLLYGMRGVRAYLEDPLPFYVFGAALGALGLLLVIFAVKGATR